MADLATLDEVKNRLDWTLDADEERAATGALEDASEMARYYGGREWSNPDTAPRMVKSIVIKAVVRLLKNPDGTIQSRAGDETLGWSADTDPDEAGLVHFTAGEIAMLRGIGSGATGGLQTAGMFAWGTTYRRRCREYDGFDYRADAGYVPVIGSDEKPFPFFVDPEGSV